MWEGRFRCEINHDQVMVEICRLYMKNIFLNGFEMFSLRLTKKNLTPKPTVEELSKLP